MGFKIKTHIFKFSRENGNPFYYCFNNNSSSSNFLKSKNAFIIHKNFFLLIIWKFSKFSISFKFLFWRWKSKCYYFFFRVIFFFINKIRSRVSSNNLLILYLLLFFSIFIPIKIKITWDIYFIYIFKMKVFVRYWYNFSTF